MTRLVDRPRVGFRQKQVGTEAMRTRANQISRGKTRRRLSPRIMRIDTKWSVPHELARTGTILRELPSNHFRSRRHPLAVEVSFSPRTLVTMFSKSENLSGLMRK